MKLEQTKARAKPSNKVAMEAEKERDASETAVEELKRQMQPKRAHTNDDAGDAHEILVNVDNWDLRDHRLWTKSHGARLYAHQVDLLDKRLIYCHIITWDSES